MQAPRSGGFCVCGWYYVPCDDYATRAEHFAPKASVPQNIDVFKEDSARLAIFGACETHSGSLIRRLPAAIP
jgi:hypothetical protein